MPHVLVVDDQPDVCAVVGMALEELGRYRVSAACSGDKALPILDRDRPDLVLLDVMMPGMSSLEFALHATRRGIPLMVMTGHPDIAEALDRLGWRYLQKPFHLHQLLTECAQTLARLQENVAIARAALNHLIDNRDELAGLVEWPRRAVEASRRADAMRTGMSRTQERCMQSVMVIEDDPTFAGAVEAYLTRAGFEVEIATDTLIGLNKVEARSFDMLVVDLAMPSGKPSGLSFARMVRHRQPGSRIVFITGYPELADVAAQLPGKVFTKPVDLDAVVSEIRSQLVA